MNLLHFPNIHDQKAVSSQVSMDKFFNSLKHMIVVTKHTLNPQNYMEKHSLQLRQPLQRDIQPIKDYYANSFLLNFSEC